MYIMNNKMKRVITSFVIALGMLNHAQGQTVYSTTQPEKVDTSFIKSFENDEQRTDLTPYTLKLSKDVFVQNTPYTIRMLKYKGWEDECGDFTVIEIAQNNLKALSLKYDDGWDYFYTAKDYKKDVSNPFKIIPLSENSTALVFTGVTITSEPPYITIVILGNNALPKMVYNVPSFIKDIKVENGKTAFTLQMNTVEYDDNNVPYNIPNNTPIIKTLTFGNGEITFK